MEHEETTTVMMVVMMMLYLLLSLLLLLLVNNNNNNNNNKNNNNFKTHKSSDILKQFLLKAVESCNCLCFLIDGLFNMYLINAFKNILKIIIFDVVQHLSPTIYFV